LQEFPIEWRPGKGIRPINEKEEHGMQVSVTFRNMEPKEVLRDYAQAKISRMKRFLDHPLAGY